MTKQPSSRGARANGEAAAIPLERLVGQPLLLMLDVDGTLAPIAAHPSLATVPGETRRVIASLVTRPGVVIALVSGRAAHDARRMVGVEKLWTIGNHGAEIIHPDGDVTIHPDVVPFTQAIARAVATLEPLLTPLKGVLLENKGVTLSVHYRTADEAVLPRLRGAVDGVAERYGLRVTEGKKVLEVRPPVHVDKGTAVVGLADELGALGASAALLFVGDDTTDEDAFRLLRARMPNAVTVHVGDARDTAAEFTLADPDDVRALLERIARAVARR